MNKRIISFLRVLFIVATFLLKGNDSVAQTFSNRPSWSKNFFSINKKPLQGWSVLKLNYPSGNQYFTDSIGNVFIKGGSLHLKATADRREDKVCSSGYVSTKGLKAFLYGKLEIRAKVPTGKGVFPGIWMLREDHGTKWPIGEIDIMEYIECFMKKEFATTIHLTYRENGYESDPIQFTHSQQNAADMTKFHIYSLLWTPDELVFALDHKVYYSLNKKDAEYWPFDVPYILIFSLGYGGWGAKCGMDDSILPKEMIIDWIKYYPYIGE